MARAATTADVFNAVAEVRRRDILNVLAGGEAAVSDLVERLAMGQPQVSKHLKVLRDVELVHYRTVGRQRLYRVNGAALRPVHDWVSGFERLWNERYDRLDDYLAELQQPQPQQPNEKEYD
jgi:DNA-binding transcriptional ArsR family regulator